MLAACTLRSPVSDLKLTLIDLFLALCQFLFHCPTCLVHENKEDKINLKSAKTMTATKTPGHCRFVESISTHCWELAGNCTKEKSSKMHLRRSVKSRQSCLFQTLGFFRPPRPSSQRAIQHQGQLSESGLIIIINQRRRTSSMLSDPQHSCYVDALLLSPRSSMTSKWLGHLHCH